VGDKINSAVHDGCADEFGEKSVLLLLLLLLLFGHCVCASEPLNRFRRAGYVAQFAEMLQQKQQPPEVYSQSFAHLLYT